MTRNRDRAESCDDGQPTLPAPEPDALQRAILALEKRGRAKWWRRRGSARRGFWYQASDGSRISDETALDRIRSLVIPPGWREVRVNPKPGGRLQVVGIDACGRLQYRYHPAFAARRQQAKYAKLLRFGQRLPDLRERTNEDLSKKGYSRERILAAATRLINDLYIRLGSDESVRRYRTFGVTTLQNRHVRIQPDGALEFRYVGKHQVRHRKVLVDEDLASLLRELKSIGGARLFNYLDENGTPRPLRPADVNRYIKSVMGSEFSAKDFRTWHGTLLAARELSGLGPPESETSAKRELAATVKKVAEQLGNTPSVCRSCYIHPAVLQGYRRGVTLEAFHRRAGRVVRMREAAYEPEEIALLELLAAGQRD